VLFGLGWLLFAIATLRAQVYRRAAAALLAIGAVLAAISLPFTAIILSVAVGWATLFTGTGVTAEQQPPRVR